MTTVLLSRILPDEISEYIIKLSRHVFKNKEELQKVVNEWCDDKCIAFRKYGDIRYWNTSKITDMSYLFFEKDEFNGDISRWDVSKVENMESMFLGASSFNQSLNKWNVSNVKNMSYMFDKSGMKISPPRY